MVKVVRVKGDAEASGEEEEEEEEEISDRGWD